MRSSNDAWQGCCNDWQNDFIKQNLLLLGYAAWQGYLNDGRGVLICKVTDEIPAWIDWQVEQVRFTQQFISQGQLSSDLRESELEQAAIDCLHQSIPTYDPTREILILIQGNGAVEINLLQPKIVPPSSYEQVQQRWAEFQLDSLQPPGKFYAGNI